MGGGNKRDMKGWNIPKDLSLNSIPELCLNSSLPCLGLEGFVIVVIVWLPISYLVSLLGLLRLFLLWLIVILSFTRATTLLTCFC